MPQCKAFGCFNRQGEGDAKGKSFFAFPKQNVDNDNNNNDNNNNDNNNKK